MKRRSSRIDILCTLAFCQFVPSQWRYQRSQQEFCEICGLSTFGAVNLPAHGVFASPAPLNNLGSNDF